MHKNMYMYIHVPIPGFMLKMRMGVKLHVSRALNWLGCSKASQNQWHRIFDD